MLRFVLRRLIYHGLLTMSLVTTTVFFVTRLLTDPVRVMLPPTATQADYDALRTGLGLDKPIFEQFLNFVGDMLRLDFGVSFWTGLPAFDVVVERLPATFLLVSAGVAAAVLVFVPVGVIASIRPGSWLDRVLSSLSLLGVSTPQFWLGAMLILTFALTLGWFPTSGFGTPGHLVLPAATIALVAGGRMAQVTRVAMIEQLEQPYITALRAKGLSTTRIVFGHVLRNSSIPIITLILYEVAYSLTGYAVIVETVFAWPGIGRLAIQAVNQRDIILLQAVVFIVAFLVVTANLIADILYKVVDPRTELAK